MKHKEILHIFTTVNYDYTNEYLKNLTCNNYLNCKNNHTIIYDNDIKLNIMSFLKKVKRSDLIIIHGIFSKINCLIYLLIPDFATKSRWIIWGGDLYDYQLKPHHNIISVFLEKVKILFIRRLDGIGAICNEEYEMAVEYTGSSAKFYQYFYEPPVNFNILKLTRNNINQTDNTTFLLGNSASKTNNHIEALNLLKTKDDRLMTIICPLTYGDSEYGNMVSKTGIQMFSSRFVPLKQHLKPKEYAKILNLVNVGFFFHDRQQGLGNIYALLFLGKKVFLKKHVTTYKFLKSLGVEVYDSEDFQNLTYQEIVKFDYLKGYNNMKVLENFFSNEKFTKLWNDIFTP